MANSLSFRFNLGIVAVQGKCNFSANGLRGSSPELHWPSISHAPSARLDHGQRRRKNQKWSGNLPRAEQRTQQLKEETKIFSEAAR
jgi:hypothetical protein